jgi:hypothetical protein
LIYNIYLLIKLIENSQASDSTEVASQASTSNTSTITDIFARQRANKRPKSPEEKFNLIKFKKLLLNFIITNNLSFRSITSKSFREVLVYLYQ